MIHRVHNLWREVQIARSARKHVSNYVAYPGRAYQRAMTCWQDTSPRRTRTGRVTRDDENARVIVLVKESFGGRLARSGSRSTYVGWD